MIAERRAELEKQPLDLNFGDVEIVDQEASYPSKRRLAFLDMLLHMAKEADFTLMDIREEVDTFMFEVLWLLGLLYCRSKVNAYFIVTFCKSGLFLFYIPWTL